MGASLAGDGRPFGIRGIDHVVIRARDFQRMIAFYRDTLGCPVERQVEDLGLAQLRAGSGLIDLVDAQGALGVLGGAPPGEAGRNLDHFCVRVEPWDPEAIRAHLESHGATPSEVASRYGAEGQGPSMYVTDPEGNAIELRGPPDPAAR